MNSLIHVTLPILRMKYSQIHDLGSSQATSRKQITLRIPSHVALGSPRTAHESELALIADDYPGFAGDTIKKRC